LRELTIDGKDCVLIEMPLSPWTDSMYRELEQIHFQLGLLPMIAHVDRYIRPFCTYGIPRRLAELPVLVQANGTFFQNRRTQKLAMRLLREGKIQALGSDCHDIKDRPPQLAEAIREICRYCGKDALKRMEKITRVVF
jgi:protein-tyrosine phosphatase